GYWSHKKGEGHDKEEVLTEYMLLLDNRFRREAELALVCFDEGGLGTGINVMRFVQMNKPILGFYNPVIKKHGVNVNNILQLKLEYPTLVTLHQYHDWSDIQGSVVAYLRNFKKP
ncbi:MAG: hypothetical protein FD130_2528, partial [Halothiobacillaceae bacterium]